MKTKNEKQSKKVATVIAFKMMQLVYSPLIKFFKEMVKNQCADYVDKYFDYLKNGIVAMHSCKMDYFINFDQTYTLNTVSKDICKLYGDYYHKCGTSFYEALETIFNCLLSDSAKYLEKHPCL